MATEAHLIYERALKLLPVDGARLGDEFFSASVPICVIDSVWSIGVRYEGVRNVVARYCAQTGLPRLHDRDELPSRETQESVSAFCARLDDMTPEAAADELFRNRQRTSTKSGILKAEAVHRFARVLKDHGVEYLQDVPDAMKSEALERAVRAVPGQSSGISLSYFWMLSGSDDHVKPDRMVIRFLEDSLGRKVEVKEAQGLLTAVSGDLKNHNPNMSPRLLDHIIWQYQRQAPTAVVASSPTSRS